MNRILQISQISEVRSESKALLMIVFSHDCVTGFGMMAGFIGLFDTARDYTLRFTITRTRWCPESRFTAVA
jgi:hypothetical protein